MEVQEEEEGNGAATPPLEPRRHKLLAAAVRKGNTPAAAVSIHMNFEGAMPSYQRWPSSQRNREGKRKISNESAWGWSLRERPTSR